MKIIVRRAQIVLQILKIWRGPSGDEETPRLGVLAQTRHGGPRGVSEVYRFPVYDEPVDRADVGTMNSQPPIPGRYVTSQCTDEGETIQAKTAPKPDIRRF